MQTEYISWLRQRGTRIFEGGGHLWRLYHGRVLIPATLAPCYITLEKHQATSLLKESGALMIRFSSDPHGDGGPWWYVVCDNYDVMSLSSKARNEINRGKRECAISATTAGWLAENGYSCYVAAQQRYQQAVTVSEATWRSGVLANVEGPFDHWIITVGDKLAGYCICVNEAVHVNMASFKADPSFFKHRTVSALVTHLQSHYVASQGRVLSNGNRPVLHETNFQDVLLKHGFRQQFCRLNIFYALLFKIGVQLTYPLRGFLQPQAQTTGPFRGLRTLLLQEQIRRESELFQAVRPEP